jgi:hypothetical protein
MLKRIRHNCGLIAWYTWMGVLLAMIAYFFFG